MKHSLAPHFSLLCGLLADPKLWQISYRDPSLTVLFTADRIGLSLKKIKGWGAKTAKTSCWMTGWIRENGGGIQRKGEREAQFLLLSNVGELNTVLYI